ncbi:MAG: HAD-IA family hydrolase [Oscillospiraceae bacterium]|nr:HAD-IA family hydrolase [Oscillospiraceae bacterium]
MSEIILFDLDGTLTDPKEGITKSYQYALSAFGIQESLDDLIQYIGPPLRETIANRYGFSPPDVEKAVAKFREYFFDAGIYENEVYAGIPELLKTLHGEGKTMAVATNKVLPAAQKVLEHFCLDRYFAFVSGDDMEGSLTKDGKRNIIRIALEAVGAADKSKAVMIGDRKHDVIGAREAGIGSIGVLYGYGSREELAGAGAAYIADTVEDLKGLLCGGLLLQKK